ncbi:MAG: TIGR02281 family clan AA aspartic protease [Hylemonella sp.]
MQSHLALLLCALALTGAAQAQTVVLSGILGGKALLVVDGGPPRSVAVGQSHQGVKVIGIQAGQAMVEIGGARQTLRLGEGPVSAPAAQSETGDQRRIVLHAGSNGHFRALGQINGRAVTFLVDTGASVVSVSAAEADRIGLNYRAGQPVQMQTANGSTTGWLVKLHSVRLGSMDIFDVEAIVSAAPMPYVLLGNSYLTRFQMTRTNDQLVLERRY